MNEQFLCRVILLVAAGWSVVNISVSLIKIHDYSFSKYMKTTLLTLGFMAVVVLLGSLFYLLTKQIIDFVRQVYTEVAIRD